MRTTKAAMTTWVLRSECAACFLCGIVVFNLDCSGDGLEWNTDQVQQHVRKREIKLLFFFFFWAFEVTPCSSGEYLTSLFRLQMQRQISGRYPIYFHIWSRLDSNPKDLNQACFFFFCFFTCLPNLSDLNLIIQLKNHHLMHVFLICLFPFAHPPAWPFPVRLSAQRQLSSHFNGCQPAHFHSSLCFRSLSTVYSF